MSNLRITTTTTWPDKNIKRNHYKLTEILYFTTKDRSNRLSSKNNKN